MRERFIAILVGLTLGVLVLYGVPRAYFLAEMVEEQETIEISRAATFTANRIESRIRSGTALDEQALASALDETDGAAYVDPDGKRMEVGRFDADPDVSIVVREDVAGGGELVLTRDREVVSERTEESLLPLILLGVGLAGVAALVAWFIAGRATAAFRQLATAADELGHGNFDLDVPTRGVPEALAIGEALTRTAAQLDQLVRREREFAANASHQLRTPITALRLELEDLTYWEETHPAVADQLRTSIRELTRLNDAIDDLLDLAKRQRHDQQVELDLTELVTDTVLRWERRFTEAGRSLVVGPSGPVPAFVAPGPVAQVLDVLLENARLHGSGAVEVTPHDQGTHVALRVRDEGIRSFGAEVFARGVSSRLGDGAGHGLGLAVASELAGAAGGRLTLDEERQETTFVLMLPKPGADHQRSFHL